MTRKQTVVLYGNSLLVSSIGASLRDCAGLRVLPLDAVLPDAEEQLSALQPDVVIFDRTAAQPSWSIALWEYMPGLLLIGMDPASDRVLVCSSHPAHALTTDALVRVIERHADSLVE